LQFILLETTGVVVLPLISVCSCIIRLHCI